ncbi:hypothetical protein [Pseudonocardia ailaonensis]|uniref:hypothetical protein n=1 Tax=Pseudonocardia ailaonensis TaxID=367279 RepID=UPI0031CFDC4E
MLTPPTGLPAVDDLGASVPTRDIVVPSQRTAPTAPPVAPPAPPVLGVCTCGHAEEAHEHYRAGSDCGACGPEVCAAFAPKGERKGGLLRTLGLRR